MVTTIQAKDWPNINAKMKIVYDWKFTKEGFIAFGYEHSDTAAQGLKHVAYHVIGGMTAMFIVSLDCLRGKNLQRVELVGIYWHFVDLVWIFLFPVV